MNKEQVSSSSQGISMDDESGLKKFDVPGDDNDCLIYALLYSNAFRGVNLQALLDKFTGIENYTNPSLLNYLSNLTLDSFLKPFPEFTQNVREHLANRVLENIKELEERDYSESEIMLTIEDLNDKGQLDTPALQVLSDILNINIKQKIISESNSITEYTFHPNGTQLEVVQKIEKENGLPTSILLLHSGRSGGHYNFYLNSQELNRLQSFQYERSISNNSLRASSEFYLDAVSNPISDEGLTKIISDMSSYEKNTTSSLNAFINVPNEVNPSYSSLDTIINKPEGEETEIKEFFSDEAYPILVFTSEHLINDSSLGTVESIEKEVILQKEESSDNYSIILELVKDDLSSECAKNLFNEDKPKSFWIKKIRRNKNHLVYFKEGEETEEKINSKFDINQKINNSFANESYNIKISIIGSPTENRFSEYLPLELIEEILSKIDFSNLKNREISFNLISYKEPCKEKETKSFEEKFLSTLKASLSERKELEGKNIKDVKAYFQPQEGKRKTRIQDKHEKSSDSRPYSNLKKASSYCKSLSVNVLKTFQEPGPIAKLNSTSSSSLKEGIRKRKLEAAYSQDLNLSMLLGRSTWSSKKNRSTQNYESEKNTKQGERSTRKGNAK